MEMALEQAKRHAASGEADIARQRGLADQLERHGHDAKLAWELLQTFEQLQAMHVAEIERLKRELAELDKRSTRRRNKDDEPPRAP
jgi:hypothetical protein